jgi:hypothetical protein
MWRSQEEGEILQKVAEDEEENQTGVPPEMETMDTV